jgi:hypothetical protein
MAIAIRKTLAVGSGSWPEKIICSEQYAVGSEEWGKFPISNFNLQFSMPFFKQKRRS